MKSQFREKTGKELPKFTPQKGGLSRQSRQGSESSLSSLVLEPTAPIQGPSQGPATLPVQTQDVQIRLSDGKVLRIQFNFSLFNYLNQGILVNNLKQKIFYYIS